MSESLELTKESWLNFCLEWFSLLATSILTYQRSSQQLSTVVSGASLTLLRDSHTDHRQLDADLLPTYATLDGGSCPLVPLVPKQT